MGVPKLYKMAFSKIDGVLTNDIKNPFSFLGDLNGLIHKIAGYKFGYGKELDGSEINPDKLRVISDRMRTKQGFKDLVSEFINAIGPVLTTLIIDTFGPTDVLILAIDGIAELAKVIQQRLRRFKSGYERFTNNKNGSPSFDTSYLTAGTEFMDRVSDAVQNWINENKTKLPKYSYFSPASDPGEGEHKIFKMLESIKSYELSLNDVITKKDKDREFRNQNHMVYGLDADLGILSMMRDYNIIWVRETFDLYRYEYGVVISVVKKHFISAMKPDSIEYDALSEEQKSLMIQDFVLLTFLIGDDFVPGMITLKCNIKRTLDRFCLAYKQYTGDEFKFLTNSTGDINWYNFRLFFENHLLAAEEELYNNLLEVDTYERLLASNQTNGEYYAKVLELRKKNVIKTNEMYTSCKLLPSTYQDFVQNWKNVMVRPALIADHLYNTPKVSMLCQLDPFVIQESVFQCCQNYLTGLQWNIKYYMGYPVNNWFYQNQLSPTISNLVEFMNSQKFISENVIRTPADPYINASQLLSIVLNPIFSRDVLNTFFKSETNHNKLLINCRYWKTYFPTTMSFVFQGGYSSDDHVKFPLLPQITLSDIMKIIKSKDDKTKIYRDNNFGILTLGNENLSVFKSRLLSSLSFGANSIRTFSLEQKSSHVGPVKKPFDNLGNQIERMSISASSGSSGSSGNEEKDQSGSERIEGKDNSVGFSRGSGGAGRGDFSGRAGGGRVGSGRGDFSGRAGGGRVGRVGSGGGRVGSGGAGRVGSGGAGRGDFTGRNGRGDFTGRNGRSSGRTSGRGERFIRSLDSGESMKVGKFRTMLTKPEQLSNFDM